MGHVYTIESRFFENRIFPDFRGFWAGGCELVFCQCLASIRSHVSLSRSRIPLPYDINTAHEPIAHTNITKIQIRIQMQIPIWLKRLRHVWNDALKGLGVLPRFWQAMTNVPQQSVLWMEKSQAHQENDVLPVSMLGPTRQWNTVVFTHTHTHTHYEVPQSDNKTTKHDS